MATLQTGRTRVHRVETRGSVYWQVSPRSASCTAALWWHLSNAVKALVVLHCRWPAPLCLICPSAWSDPLLDLPLSLWFLTLPDPPHPLVYPSAWSGPLPDLPLSLVRPSSWSAPLPVVPRPSWSIPSPGLPICLVPWSALCLICPSACGSSLSSNFEGW